MVNGTNKTQASRCKQNFLRAAICMVVLAVFVTLGFTQTVQAATEDNKYVIVLDAGHGGQDPGAVDPVNGYYESHLVLTSAQLLADYFAANSEQVEVVLTRTSDEYVGISQRAAYANSVNADVFISLHLNAAENTEAQGFQIFPAVPGRTNHEASLQLAENIVASVAELGRPLRGTNGIYYCYYKNGSKVFYDSAEYAGGGNTSSFGVLEGADCAAVLVEQWFITNADDMAYFNTESGQAAMAQQLYQGVCNYLGIAY